MVSIIYINGLWWQALGYESNQWFYRTKNDIPWAHLNNCYISALPNPSSLNFMLLTNFSVIIIVYLQSAGYPDLDFMLRINQILIDFVKDRDKNEWANLLHLSTL